MINKISSYIGFAKKSKQIVIGTDNVLQNSKIKIVIISSKLADNAKQKIQNKYVVYILDANDFDTAVGMAGVKVIGLLDENLANAIRNLLEVQ